MEGSLTNSLEISQFLIQRGFQGAMYNAESFIESDTTIVYRVANIQNVAIETEGAIAADDLKTIIPYDGVGFQDGDIIYITGNNSSRIVTVKSYVGGQDNIYLANDLDWDSGDKENVLALQYWNTNSGSFWFEMFRSPSTTLSVQALRDVSIAEPVQGINEQVMPTSGTINIVAGVDKGYQLITGSPTLIGSVVYQPNAAPTIPYLDGDTIIYDYRATPTVGANTVTIGGITLTDEQAEGGKVKVTSTYKLSNTTWYSTLEFNSEGVDLATSTQLATKQDLLPTPTADGMVLAGNTDDTKYWIPNTNQYQWYIATYDFDLYGGAQGTIDLQTTIPAEAVVLANLCFIKTTTAFTSGGSATIEIGLTGGDDDIDQSRAYTVAPYDSTSGIDYANPPVNILRLSTSSKNVTMTITTADLTAGVAKIYIATVLN